MNTNFRALISAEVALEEVPDALENIVDGLLHLEGDGAAVKPDLDEEETLVEVFDGALGRTQHLPGSKDSHYRCKKFSTHEKFTKGTSNKDTMFVKKDYHLNTI